MNTNPLLRSINYPIAFDEYKLVFESAERVTDRRLDLTKTNSSLAALVIAGLGVMCGWGYHEGKEVLLVVLGFAILISILGWLFCSWWKSQMETYKDLNAAKFEVLKDMYERLEFAGYGGIGVRSARPFEREWAYLGEAKALQSYHRGFALRATNSEIIVAHSFLIFFAVSAGFAMSFEFLQILRLLGVL